MNNHDRKILEKAVKDLKLLHNEGTSLDADQLKAVETARDILSSLLKESTDYPLSTLISRAMNLVLGAAELAKGSKTEQGLKSAYNALKEQLLEEED